MRISGIGDRQDKGAARPHDPWFLVALRAGLYAVAVVLLFWRYALPLGLVSGVGGVCFGVVFAHALLRCAGRLAR